MTGLDAEYGGGWMIAMAEALCSSGSVSLSIAAVHSGSTLQRLKHENITYYLLPGGPRAALSPDARLAAAWRKVIEDASPEIIHLHGSEYAHGIPLLDVCADIPTVLSMQGIVGVYAEHYVDWIEPKDLRRYRTFRDVIRRDDMRQQQKKFRLRGNSERELILRVNNVIGRTTFDRLFVSQFKPGLPYYHNNENLRDAFYGITWNIQAIRRNSIFIGQASVPYKGFHVMVRAMPYLLEKYPETRLIVAGIPLCDLSTWSGRIRENGYSRFIRDLIRGLGVEGHIEYSGALTAASMARALCNSHVFALPSCIDNSPNSLGEAQLIGVPCVATSVGGVPDMVKEGDTGLLSDSGDHKALAERILEIFNFDNLACSLSGRARQVAARRHDRILNRAELEAIYSRIIGSASAR
jgi:glycosyltransferase involved in cell wall biosynthesis